MATDLQITGMTCQHCVRAVTEALSAVPGSGEVSVDLASGRARISGQAEVAALAAAVVEAGFAAEPA